MIACDIQWLLMSSQRSHRMLMLPVIVGDNRAIRRGLSGQLTVTHDTDIDGICMKAQI